MSELKWNWVYCPYLDPPEKQKESALKAGYNKVYLKSEVDKVIAHSKYKRCLVMAHLCWDKWYETVGWKCEWWWRWRIKWLGLAEKFKEAK